MPLTFTHFWHHCTKSDSYCLQVVFDYTAYNEQGRRIDTTYTKGAPARTRVGIQGLIPGALKVPKSGFKTSRDGCW